MGKKTEIAGYRTRKKTQFKPGVFVKSSQNTISCDINEDNCEVAVSDDETIPDGDDRFMNAKILTITSVLLHRLCQVALALGMVLAWLSALLVVLRVLCHMWSVALALGRPLQRQL